MAVISPQTHLKPRNVDNGYISFRHCLLAGDHIICVSHKNHTLSQVGISRTIWQLEVSGAVNPTLSWINLEVSNTVMLFDSQRGFWPLWIRQPFDQGQKGLFICLFSALLSFPWGQSKSSLLEHIYRGNAYAWLKSSQFWGWVSWLSMQRRSVAILELYVVWQTVGNFGQRVPGALISQKLFSFYCISAVTKAPTASQ